MEHNCSKVCIYRVTDYLRTENQKPYTPSVISIGPLHYKKKGFSMEYKMKYIRNFLALNSKNKWLELKAYIKDKEKHIRDCYEEISKLQSREYRKMILYDAIFIIELFMDDDFDETYVYYSLIKQDLQLIENQLPYFVLEELYELIHAEETAYPPFIYLSCLFFGHNISPQVFQRNKIEVKHFTDLRRYTLLLNNPKENDQQFLIKRAQLDSAVRLPTSGVKLKPLRMKETSCFSFQTNELQISPLSIDDEFWEVSMRNVMAFEQCYYPQEANYIFKYISSLFAGIWDEKDLVSVRKKGIIRSGMRNNEIMTMFHQLRLDGFVDPIL